MNAVALPIELFNATVDYLTKQPYGEVHQLVDALREQVKTVKLEEEDTDGKE